MKKIVNLLDIEYIVKNQLLVLNENNQIVYTAGDLKRMTLEEILYNIMDNYYYED